MTLTLCCGSLVNCMYITVKLLVEIVSYATIM